MPRTRGLPVLGFARVLFWILLFLALVYAFVSPQFRKQVIRTAIFVAVMIFALNRLRETLTPKEPEETPVGLAEQPPPGAYANALPDPPSIVTSTPDWIVWTITILFALLLVVLVWFLWRKLRPRAEEEDAQAQVAQQAGAALSELEQGGDLREVILRCYAQMSNVLHENSNVKRHSAMTPRDFEEHLTQLGIRRPTYRSLDAAFRSGTLQHWRSRPGSRGRGHGLSERHCAGIRARRHAPASSPGERSPAFWRRGGWATAMIRRFLPLALLAATTLVLAFLVEDFVREVVVVPVLYVGWFSWLTLINLPQWTFWVLLTVVAATLAIRSLSGEKRQAVKRPDPPPSAHGPVNIMDPAADAGLGLNRPTNGGFHAIWGVSSGRPTSPKNPSMCSNMWPGFPRPTRRFRSRFATIFWQAPNAHRPSIHSGFFAGHRPRRRPLTWIPRL